MEAVKGAIGATVDKVFFGSNGEQTLYNEYIRGAIGNKNWEVVVLSSTDDRFDILDKKIDDLTGRLVRLEDIQLIPWIRNIAATILLYLLGVQPYGQTDSYRFRNAKGDSLLRIVAFVDNNNCFELEKFKNFADGIISRRNIAMHPMSLDALHVLVQEALEAIAGCPRLRKLIKPEIQIIEEYDSMKSFFPPVNGTTGKPSASETPPAGASTAEGASSETGGASTELGHI